MNINKRAPKTVIVVKSLCRGGGIKAQLQEIIDKYGLREAFWPFQFRLNHAALVRSSFNEQVAAPPHSLRPAKLPLREAPSDAFVIQPILYNSNERKILGRHPLPGKTLGEGLVERLSTGAVDRTDSRTADMGSDLQIVYLIWSCARKCAS